MNPEKIIGFTCGAFDLLHAGHIAMLEECKTYCHYLKVGLQIDPSIDRANKNPPVQSLYERYVQLRAVKWVDEIIPYTTEAELLNLLKMELIDIRFLGQDYLHKHFTGENICIDRDITFRYTKRYHEYSSSELRERVINAASPRTPTT